MVTRYNREIEKIELEGVLLAQQHAQKTAQADILKLRGRIEDNEITIVSLDKAIAETKRKLGSLV